MAGDATKNVQAHQQPPEPNPTLKSLNVMVGTWNIEGREAGSDGEIRGQVAFEWMEGGFFLVQRVYIDYAGRKITGVEYVGYDESNTVLKSYFFSNMGSGPFPGPALEYVWEVGDDTLTIWGGFVGSPASFIRNPGGGFHPLPCASREKEIRLPVVINRISYQG